MTRPDRTCNICGVRTTAASGTCASCARLARCKPGKEHALVDGRLVRVGLIWRFERYVGPVEPPKPKRRKQTWQNVKRRDWANMGDCPSCGAKPGAPCLASGRTVPAHRARLEPKTCVDCGVVIPSTRTYCEPHRVERRRATWRQQGARKREAA